jgi:hypothetical protein
MVRIDFDTSGGGAPSPRNTLRQLQARRRPPQHLPRPRPPHPSHRPARTHQTAAARSLKQFVFGGLPIIGGVVNDVERALGLPPLGGSTMVARGPLGGAVVQRTGPLGLTSTTAARGPLGGSVVQRTGPLGGSTTVARGPLGGTVVQRQGPLGGTVTRVNVRGGWGLGGWVGGRAGLGYIWLEGLAWRAMRL